MKTKVGKQDKVSIITMGCSKNQVDSEVIASQLLGQGYNVQFDRQDPNVVIINTCGFIDLAKQESIDTILSYAEAKKNGQIDKLYVTGCLSQRYKDDLETEIPEVDAFFGTFDLPFLLEEMGADYRQELIGERTSLTTPSHYAYLKISEGCNRTCAFCAIPLMRGNHVSKTIEDIVSEAKNLVKNGVKEIMLIAQELTYYGLDIYKERQLPQLLRALNQIEGLHWIRLHYAYPSKFPIEIIHAMKECDKVCNYLDMPLQHASNNMLKAMRRQITREETEELVQNIRKILPNIAIRTTMLVGFPGETQEDIDEMIDFIERMKFERLGVFEYSHEENTPGYELQDDVSPEDKALRAAKVMQAQEAISWNLNQAKIGQTFKVLIDRKEGDFFIGRTEFDSPEVDNEVLIEAKKQYVRIGDFAPITINHAEEFDLYGELLKLD